MELLSSKQRATVIIDGSSVCYMLCHFTTVGFPPSPSQSVPYYYGLIWLHNSSAQIVILNSTIAAAAPALVCENSSSSLGQLEVA